MVYELYLNEDDKKIKGYYKKSSNYITKKSYPFTKFLALNKNLPNVRHYM